MATPYSKEQIAAYYKARRERWADSKKKAETDQVAQALLQESGLGCSPASFYYVYSQMRDQGLSGIPYVHAKTFDKWVASGFKVKKGSKSTLEGLTWISASKKGADGKVAEDDSYLFPKVYHLFHESQVEAIA